MVKEQNATVHFVDDRFETVKAVAGEPSLGKVQVYMADWLATAHHDQGPMFLVCGLFGSVESHTAVATPTHLVAVRTTV